MKAKKIILIIILIAFIGIIGFVLIKAGSKSEEKISEASKNNTNENVSTSLNTIGSSSNSSSEEKKSSGVTRKSNGNVEIDSNNILEIKDNFFIEQTNDIYLNYKDYVGKTVKMEGLVYSYQDDNGDTCYAVVRNTPGCCGNDGLAGLDIRYDKDYPKVNTWIEVVGVIGTDTMYGETIPAIQVSTMEEKEQGTTFVTN